MNSWKDILTEFSKKIGIDISDKQLYMFETYMNMLLEWNKNINLTAITEPEEIAVKHFFDSLTVSKYSDFNKKIKMIDIGTGAGFPSIPLLIIFNDIELTMLDSLNKRLIFLQAVLDELQLKANIVHARAEDLSRNAQYREKFDIATARAVANMNQLCEYCIPYVKKNGYFIAMKGSNGKQEAEDAVNAVHILGGDIEKTDSFILPDNSERNIILVKKVSSTPDKYPRNSGKINKSPLK